jgi:hypothetical protein
MTSKRTIITISDQERRWLASYVRTHRVSMAEAIRRGIACLKSSEGLSTYQKLVNNTKGAWSKGDGLNYQEQLRAEWTP